MANFSPECIEYAIFEGTTKDTFYIERMPVGDWGFSWKKTSHHHFKKFSFELVIENTNQIEEAFLSFFYIK